MNQAPSPHLLPTDVFPRREFFQRLGGGALVATAAISSSLTAERVVAAAPAMVSDVPPGVDDPTYYADPGWSM